MYSNDVSFWVSVGIAGLFIGICVFAIWETNARERRRREAEFADTEGDGYVEDMVVEQHAAAVLPFVEGQVSDNLPIVDDEVSDHFVDKPVFPFPEDLAIQEPDSRLTELEEENYCLRRMVGDLQGAKVFMEEWPAVLMDMEKRYGSQTPRNERPAGGVPDPAWLAMEAQIEEYEKMLLVFYENSLTYK